MLLALKFHVDMYTLPNRIPHWQMHSVSINALVGSPRFDDTANGWRNGIIWSLAIACNWNGHCNDIIFYNKIILCIIDNTFANYKFEFKELIITIDKSIQRITCKSA